MLVEFHDPRIIVAVGDEDIAVKIPGHIGRAIEHAPTGNERGARCVRHDFFDGFVAAAQREKNFPGGTELHDHVRPFVARPDVLVLVDLDRVREGEAVEILADLSNERAVGTELPKLRGGGAMHGAPLTGAMKDVEVLRLVDGDTGDLAKVETCGRSQDIALGIELDLGDLRVRDGHVATEQAEEADQQRQGAGEQRAQRTGHLRLRMVGRSCRRRRDFDFIHLQCAQRDLNPQPFAPKANALSN